MFPWRPCLSMFRCRESAALVAKSEGADPPSDALGPLLLRPVGGTGGKSFFDILVLLPCVMIGAFVWWFRRPSPPPSPALALLPCHANAVRTIVSMSEWRGDQPSSDA